MSDIARPPADHRVKIPHLVFGLLFLGVAGIWWLVERDVITADSLTILAPGVLIAAGVIGLVASLASSRNRNHVHTDTFHPADPEATEPPAEAPTEEIR